MWRVKRWILVRLELLMLRFLMRLVTEGVYHFRYVAEEDLIKRMKVERDWGEFDGLVYRREIKGKYSGRHVKVFVWRDNLQRFWIEWI